MAIGTGAAILGGALISGVLGSRSSRRAANAAAAGDQAAIEEQRRQFDLIMRMQQPYRTVGVGALNNLASIYGLPTYQIGGANLPPGSVPIQPDPLDRFRSGSGGGIYGNLIRRALGPARPANEPTVMDGGPMAFEGGWQNPLFNYEKGQNQISQSAPQGPNYSPFFASPDYQFRRDEGMRDIGNSFAARGGAFSGNALRGLTDFNQNLAASEFGNYFNRQAALAGIGQTATNSLTNAAGQSGANIAGLLSNQGQARASGIMGQANSIGGAINSGLQNWLLMRGGYFG